MPKNFVIVLSFFILTISLFNIPVHAENNSLQVDLIVVGSDPEGISAAVAGSRQGLETILVCHKDRLGGLFTRGGLNTLDMNYSPDGELLTRGIFQEFFKQIEGSSFDTNTAEQVFSEMLDKANIQVFLEAKNIQPKTGPSPNFLVADKKVTGLEFSHNGQNYLVQSTNLIDATQDAEIAYKAGAEFTYGMEDFEGPKQGMGATLIFGLDNVNWSKATQHIRETSVPNTGYDEVSIWGFWTEMQHYEPHDDKIRFRGLNIGRQNDGSVLLNTMYIFDFDHLCPEERQEAINRGKKELTHLVPFIQENIPGFENSSLCFVGEELYIRETRHLKSLYRLTINDVLEHRDFWDKIALGSYPVDIQDLSPVARGFVVGDPDKYSIPFRSIVPERIDGILVTSRSAGYDSLPHGSARVVPIGMCVGEAAGVASALKTDYGNTTWQNLAREKNFISRLQTELNKQGAYLPYFHNQYPHSLTDHWAYPQIRMIRSLGLIVGGYDNNYRLGENVSPEALQNLFNGAIQRNFPEENFPYFYTRARERVTLKDAATLFLSPLNIRSENPVVTAQKENLIPAELPEEAKKEGTLNRETLLYLLGEYLVSLENHLD